MIGFSRRPPRKLNCSFGSIAFPCVRPRRPPYSMLKRIRFFLNSVIGPPSASTLNMGEGGAMDQKLQLVSAGVVRTQSRTHHGSHTVPSRGMKKLQGTRHSRPMSQQEAVRARYQSKKNVTTRASYQSPYSCPSTDLLLTFY